MGQMPLAPGQDKSPVETVDGVQMLTGPGEITGEAGDHSLHPGQLTRVLTGVDGRNSLVQRGEKFVYLTVGGNLGHREQM